MRPISQIRSTFRPQVSPLCFRRSKAFLPGCNAVRFNSAKSCREWEIKTKYDNLLHENTKIWMLRLHQHVVHEGICIGAWWTLVSFGMRYPFSSSVGLSNNNWRISVLKMSFFKCNIIYKLKFPSRILRHNTCWSYDMTRGTWR